MDKSRKLCQNCRDKRKCGLQRMIPGCYRSEVKLKLLSELDEMEFEDKILNDGDMPTATPDIRG